MATAVSSNTEAPPALDDFSLLRRVAAGEAAAFEPLMRRHNRRLFRLARAILRNDAEAEDALQEAYLAAYRAAGTFRGEAAPLTWLCHLVRNACFARMRRQSRRDNVLPIGLAHDAAEIEAMPDAPLESPESLTLRAQMRNVLAGRLDQLPEAFRTVFVLRCVEEMSVEETAACLAIPEATVRSRLHRARALLRAALERDLDLVAADLYAFGGDHCDRVVAAVMRRIEAGG